MKDHDIADQIQQGCKDALQRYDQEPKVTRDQHDRAVVAAYLSGISQTVDFLLRMDGSVTPQQMHRALPIVADRMGFSWEPPRE
ncbi:MAG: hypothetical protein KGL39_60245 [Patescibacteria group bacterium]|nr:hypothetical protein [Patescibacteria group bacterium]